MNNIINFIISTVFPKTCSLCGKTFSFKYEYNICEKCLNSLHKLDGLFCKKCSMPLSDGGAHCYNCKTDKNIYFDILRAPYIYDGNVRKLIKKFKYSNKTFLSKDLSRQMADLILKEKLNDAIDMVIPVPLHLLKKLQRGYNQSVLLAENISERISKPVYNNALIRTKYTKPQFKLKKNERERNLKNIFKLNKNFAGIVKNKNILLIDDIATTCATINQCSKTLKDYKANKIFAVTAARTAY